MVRVLAKEHPFAAFLLSLVAGAGVFVLVLPFVHWGIALFAGLVVSSLLDDLAL